MDYCETCLQEVPARSRYCPYCGAALKAASLPVDMPVQEEEYRAYIGPKADRYLQKFRKFTRIDAVGFALTWNWSAFLAGCWWMLYRKMYWWSLIAFLTWTIPHVALPAMFVWGAAGNYLYFRQAQKKIEGYKRVTGGTFSPEALTRLGGVHRWVWITGLVVGFLIIGVFILISLVLYQFFNHNVVVLPEMPEIQRL